MSREKREEPAGALVLARQTIAVRSRSFSLASRLLSPRVRDRVAVVYAWCRRADDAVDSGPASERAAAGARLRRELDLLYRGHDPGDPVLEAFAAVARETGIPRTYPDELVAGMEMDLEKESYRTLKELYLYAYRAAGTVGLMMSHVFGVRDDGALRHAAHLGIAMQLTNICRDVLEDWHLGRLYLPEDVLEEEGAPGLSAKLGGPPPASARRALGGAARALLCEAERFYASGERGLEALPWRCALAVRAARRIYGAIGDEIARRDFDVLAGRAVVPRWRKLFLAAKAASRGLAELPGRALRAGSSFRPPRSRLEFPDGVLPL